MRVTSDVGFFWLWRMKGINGGSRKKDGKSGNKRRVLLDAAYPFPRQWLEGSKREKRD